jgi:hypothetical protein
LVDFRGMGTLLLAGLELSAEDINAYGLVIGGSAVVILSYFANLLARRTNIPSVLVLIGMGIGIRQAWRRWDSPTSLSKGSSSNCWAPSA